MFRYCNFRAFCPFCPGFIMIIECKWNFKSFAISPSWVTVRERRDRKEDTSWNRYQMQRKFPSRTLKIPGHFMDCLCNHPQFGYNGWFLKVFLQTRNKSGANISLIRKCNSFVLPGALSRNGATKLTGTLGDAKRTALTRRQLGMHHSLLSQSTLFQTQCNL